MSPLSLQSLKVPRVQKRVVFVPDHLFFIRVVPVSKDAGEIRAQIELALEGLSPFPTAQLYYGFHHTEGAESALVFAAYKKRFTPEQISTWDGADLVVPAFAVWLASEPDKHGKALLIEGQDGVTALGWEAGSRVPGVFAAKMFGDNPTDEERLAARTEVAKSFSGDSTIVAVTPPAGSTTSLDEEGFDFKTGDMKLRIENSLADCIDIRDKEVLTGRQRERRRNDILWRTLQVCAAIAGLAIVTETVLLGMKFWQASRENQIAAQAPLVQKIEATHTLNARIDELSEKRLLPLEMLAIINQKRPPTMGFTQIATKGLNTLVIIGQSPSSPEVDAYRAAISELPECQSVSLDDIKTDEGMAKFTLSVTFKPGAINLGGSK